MRSQRAGTVGEERVEVPHNEVELVRQGDFVSPKKSPKRARISYQRLIVPSIILEEIKGGPSNQETAPELT